MKQKYEMADRSIEALSVLLKEKLDNEFKSTEEVIKELSTVLLLKVTHFEELACAPSYTKLIEHQLVVVQQRILTSSPNSSTMSELQKTKEQLERKIELVRGAYTSETDIYFSK